ncbi:Niemann-Pick type C-related protein-like protein [Emericellopsis cladophorae]|uniref:Niemann-Pick type C-related protein-like protein n=1 Tax=Emericellopsis cladophorae TaxID=2686198 RepID=A0A9P9Y607_9HYPO|nr:Niemann-Pick type C-related protein-like protein [Emericellopsis cladophorae]KAI6783569.1 Niemann-Pick type C-related protein-like protein [Emericellopsis cladophorae]
MRHSVASWLGVATTTLLLATTIEAKDWTPKHESGRCAFRGHCGKQSFFGKELPCVDNGLAEDPDAELRKELVDLCGAKWAEGPVCCDLEQVKALKSEMGTPNTLIGSCPACKDNFFNMFCTFTCSPDQSTFINITQSEKKGGKQLVTELDQLISEEYGKGFYNSCKEVKFGGANSKAMDLIGGGATDYHQLLKFLGTKKPFVGSPFQINFPEQYDEQDMEPLEMKPKKCNDEDPDYRCVCVDCPEVCPELPDVKETDSCHVGVLPCLSFASIFVYSILLFAFIVLAFGHVAWRRFASRRVERTRLLHQSSHSDDEDEGGPVATEAMRDRPTKRYRLNDACDKVFYKLGHAAARFPAMTIGASLVIVAILSAGLFRFDIEQAPAKLWVSPSSAAAQEKAYFDSNFGPFYRAEKIFLVNDTLPSGPGPVLSYETLQWWTEVEKSIEKLESPVYGKYFQDVCFKPTGDDCVVQSVTAYWYSKGGIDEDYWKEDLRACARSPVDCRPAFGQPLEPNMLLSGYGDDVTDATAMTVTWVVKNAQEGSGALLRAIDFENVMLERLHEVQQEAQDRGLRLSFNTEVSLEQELNKSTNTDAKIIVISYIVMFIYACMALGTPLKHIFRNPAVLLVESKVTLGLVGIIIVLMSIAASVGFFSWVGLKATLIILEVIPFIVLAVGVDNIFLIVHELERVNASCPDKMVEERVARALGRMGPSILFSALTETVAFALGAAVGMPAVRNFAAYAAGAVFVNALLQMTMFVSFLSLNQMRVEDHRCELWPWWQITKARIHLNGTNGYATGAARSAEIEEESFLQIFIRSHYAPRLLQKRVKMAVITIFLGLFAAAIALLPGIELGLDQRVAIPDGSYLIPYFNDLYEYLDTGPPVYFVTRDLDVAQRREQQEICSRFTTCQDLSLTNTLELERQRPDVSYISTPTASWIDDFFMWLNPIYESCCIEAGQTCFTDRKPEWNTTLHGMPEGDEFIRYLEKFLTTPAGDECPLGGQSAYGGSVILNEDGSGVKATNFRTMHTPLRSQEDFISAYSSARRIASEISERTGADVFPYSVFYIFFHQYLDIVGLTAGLLCAVVGIIFVVAAILLGSVLTSAVVTVTVVMSVIDIMGAMSVFHVSLNAVSLVNLIICVGISVEFCAHIARAFMFPSCTVMQSNNNGFRGRDARAWTALVNVGGSVFSGITITKLLGVCVLAFTRSKIFEIYYFRVWLSLVIFAALHALVFLPVALSIAGGQGYVDPESEGTAAQDLTDRRWRATQPDSDDDEY